MVLLAVLCVFRKTTCFLGRQILFCLLFIKLDGCLASRVRPDDRGSVNLFKRLSCDTVWACGSPWTSWSSSLGSSRESILLCSFDVKILSDVLVRRWARVESRSFLVGPETCSGPSSFLSFHWKLWKFAGFEFKFSMMDWASRCLMRRELIRWWSDVLLLLFLWERKIILGLGLGRRKCGVVQPFSSKSTN